MHLLVRLILTDSGADVVVAESVGEALAIVENQPPDVIVSDIGMPEADGFALAAEIRSRYHGAIPTIALTAYVGESDNRRAVASGFAAFLPKPLQANLLLETIARVVRKFQPAGN